ncbi:MAG: 1-acyl-sn-glycerol-3-phosphate acyltransferase [Burkholderiales bacterium]|nr:1-acyl-sn-glycerol-3-phosphate acyltransferase [Burkholderiales bacterium]
MTERLNLSWRVIATGLCFACFGAGGVLLGLLGVPLLGLLVRDPAQRGRIAKRVISAAFRLFVTMMSRLGVMSYEVHGRDRLRSGGLLILANHPTLIDVVLLMSFVERADCIVKGALAHNPFTRGPVRAAGFAFNDSGTGLVADCLASLRAGNNLIVFPEGTRTPASGGLHLQRGAARIAVHGELDITPVRIQCTPATLGKGDKWYRVPRTRAHFRIEVCETISVAPFTARAASQALAARHLTDYLTEYFSMENRCATT